MAKRERKSDWSAVVASHGVEWEDGPDGGAVLLVPRFRRGPLARWLQPKLRRPHIRVKLDEIGSFAWRRLDGKTPFAEVAAAMRERFGEGLREAEPRLRQFLAILFKHRFVQLSEPRRFAP